ncbi:DUF7878 domain-containing protein [Paractinoplanes atraurantiacus]|uniref:DUF7878 domain-containing protein n=1 Tax=Paractinoplanes atraurantiacus TaxID=1036182 RepID=UPI003F691187
MPRENELHRSHDAGPSLSHAGRLLVNVEADLEVAVAGRVVYAERLFPVLELARELVEWIELGGGSDFLPHSLSFDAVGAVSIMRRSDGWTVSSVFEPKLVSCRCGEMSRGRAFSPPVVDLPARRLCDSHRASRGADVSRPAERPAACC